MMRRRCDKHDYHDDYDNEDDDDDDGDGNDEDDPDGDDDVVDDDCDDDNVVVDSDDDMMMVALAAVTVALALAMGHGRGGGDADSTGENDEDIRKPSSRRTPSRTSTSDSDGPHNLTFYVCVGAGRREHCQAENLPPKQGQTLGFESGVFPVTTGSDECRDIFLKLPIAPFGLRSWAAGSQTVFGIRRRHLHLLHRSDLSGQHCGFATCSWACRQCQSVVQLLSVPIGRTYVSSILLCSIHGVLSLSAQGAESCTSDKTLQSPLGHWIGPEGAKRATQIKPISRQPVRL